MGQNSSNKTETEQKKGVK